jgi:N-acetylneuraminate synthase/N,N'-diacetyllegionaminate synthase
MEIGDWSSKSDSVYFIAEAGVNHNGDIEMAKSLVDAATEADADAVKFQTFSADRLVTRDVEKSDYQVETSGEETQYEMLKRYEMNREAHERLQSYCDDNGITFLSTPFDIESADMLADLGVPAFKLGSSELDNYPLLEHVAEFGKPMIVSTGMGTMDEVLSARDVIRSVDASPDLVFLHCTSAYPCDIEDVNLRAMESMDKELTEPVGYSDHTTRPDVPAFAVAAGACIVEKHFTMDRTLPGPDHDASLEPDELANAVELTQVAARARGSPVKAPTDTEAKNKPVTRKSLHATVDLSAGTRIDAGHLDILRPTDGLSPRHFDVLIGAETTRELSAGEPITASDVTVDVDDNNDV